MSTIGTAGEHMIFGATGTPQRMTYQEREILKSTDFGDQSRRVLVMIAHWMRQSEQIPFTDYAANWAASETRGDVSRLREAWPLKGLRMIGDNKSEWGTA